MRTALARLLLKMINEIITALRVLIIDTNLMLYKRDIMHKISYFKFEPPMFVNVFYSPFSNEYTKSNL